MMHGPYNVSLQEFYNVMPYYCIIGFNNRLIALCRNTLKTIRLMIVSLY